MTTMHLKHQLEKWQLGFIQGIEQFLGQIVSDLHNRVGRNKNLRQGCDAQTPGQFEHKVGLGVVIGRGEARGRGDLPPNMRDRHGISLETIYVPAVHARLRSKVIH